MAASGGGGREGKEVSQVERYKLKKMLAMLEKARGNGTSMITLILPPKSQIPITQKMLTDEYGTATNIKSRVNRLSVLSAITSAQGRLKAYSKCPENGLVVFVGEVVTEDGKSKKLSVDFEPFRPINTSLYMCDSRFHTESLRELLQDDDTFGFLVMDGNGSLYGTVCGSTRTVLHKFTVELPKKHGRGGQSSMRFARLRLEKRHNYLRKVAEMCTTMFITDDVPNIKGLVLAGSAEFKSDLARSDLFDPRLRPIVIKMVDVSYGGESGFHQAIDLSADALANVKLVEEKKILGGLFEEIARDTGKYCVGIKDTMTALEMSAVDTLIVWEDLEVERLELRNPSTDVHKVHYIKPDEEPDASLFRDEASGTDMEIVSQELLSEWLADHYTDFGAKIEFVTDRSGEGSQFVKGFGGVAGTLRWTVDFVELAIADEFAEDDDDDFI